MLIKKIFSFAISFTVLCVFAAFSCSAFSISAQSAVVLDARNNEVLFESSAYEKRSMASTTKIMTAILAVESGRLEENVDITAVMTKAEGTSIGLKPGYKLKLFDLVYGMMLESGNDAANAVALYLADSFGSFASMMNQKAAEIGMSSTNFVTPSGLDDEDHYSTAYDMALLASYCIKNPIFRSVCSDKNYVAELVSPVSTRLYFSNHNRLLSSVKGVFGVKTGFTKKSGRCLVSAIEKGGAVLVAVTLKAPDDWNDHKKLFSLCLGQYETVEEDVSFPHEVTVESGLKEKISVSPDRDKVELAVKKGEKVETCIKFPHFVYAPVKKGDIIGKIDYMIKGNVVDSIYLSAAEDVFCVNETYAPKKSFINRLTEWFKSFFV